jgi:hypothetical protein
MRAVPGSRRLRPDDGGVYRCRCFLSVRGRIFERHFPRPVSWQGFFRFGFHSPCRCIRPNESSTEHLPSQYRRKSEPFPRWP